MASTTNCYDLYQNDYSLCSLMTRYTFAVRQNPKRGADDVVLRQHNVDIFFNLEQLNEKFLVEINPKGQVPVLVNDAVLQKPLTESLDIALLFAEQFPALKGPLSYRARTKELLQEIHLLDYYILTFSRSPMIAENTMNGVKKRLEMPGISKAYHDALKFKLRLYESGKAASFTPNYVSDEREKASKFLAKVNEEMDEQGPWIWGKEGPNMFDAHLAVFLCRMRDAGNDDFFTPKLTRYLDTVRQTAEWQAVMQGRNTLPDPYMRSSV